MLDDCLGWGREFVPLEEHSYAEAGRAVMYYLLDTGLATEFIPRDRSMMLPPFPGVRARPHSMDWGQDTLNLGSMMTAAQVLLAGWVARHEQPGHARDLDLTAIDIRRAEQMTTGYAEEYVSDSDFAERDAAARRWLLQMHDIVRAHLHAHWRAVEVLALAIRVGGDDRTLDRDRVYTLIRLALGQR
ncbi:MAG: hypothetical protein NZM00_04780 [Anaerolinea sp.]|nr:hypothetical protein [Anaerolinea sp.]